MPNRHTNRRSARAPWAGVGALALVAAGLLGACGNDGSELLEASAATTANPSGASGSGNTAASAATTRVVTTLPNATGADGYGTTDCPPATGVTTPVRSFATPFKRCIDVNKSYTATITTNKGVLTVALDPKAAPLAVNNFVALARNKYFDGLACHRIIPKFVAQCGDPLGTGTGGPGFKFIDELPKAGAYKVGSLAMANAGPNTNGSQFFIIIGADGVALPPKYTLFGNAVGGQTTIAALDAAGNPANNGQPPKQPVSITSVVIAEQ